MKKYIPALLFVMLPFYYSCVSQDMANFTPVTPGISAINNGANWAATLTDTIANDSMQLNGSTKLDLFRIKIPIATSATLPLSGANNRYFIRNNSGNIIKTFKLDNKYTNSVTVTLNPAARSITGGFSLRFIIDTLVARNDTTGTDTVTFTNGYFIAPSK